MSSKSESLGASSSFQRAGQARSVRRQLTDAAFGGGVPTELPPQAISANPDNPREAVGDVSGLAESLLEVGQVQAITVASVEAYLRERPQRAGELEAGAEFVVVDGHRRLMAAREAGLATVKVTVDDTRVSTDEALLEAAFVANAQRENLSDLEEAQALRTLVDFYGSQRQAAKRLGVSQPYISQRLSLLSLAPDLQADLQAGRRKVEHVRNLGNLPAEEQQAAADARAAQAAKRRAEQPAASGSPSPAASAEGDYGVITSPPPGAPTGGATVAAEADTVVVAPRTAPGGQAAAPAPAGGGLPWDDPHALARLLRARMPAESRMTLAKLLADD